MDLRDDEANTSPQSKETEVQKIETQRKKAVDAVLNAGETTSSRFDFFPQ